MQSLQTYLLLLEGLSSFGLVVWPQTGLSQERSGRRGGDYMILGGLETRKDLNGMFVEVIGPGEEEGKWIVKHFASDMHVCVSTDKLVRLRPTA